MVMRILILKEFEPSVKIATELSPNVQISRDKKIFHVLVLVVVFSKKVAMRCDNTVYESKKFYFKFQNSNFMAQERTLRGLIRRRVSPSYLKAHHLKLLEKWTKILKPPF